MGDGTGDTGCWSLQGNGVHLGDGPDPTCDAQTSQDEPDPPPPHAILVGSAAGCSSTPGSTLAWVVALVVLLRRIGPLALLLAIPTLAHAVDVDHLDPDGGTWAALREGDLGPSGEAQIALVGSVARSPAVLSNGHRTVDLLSVVTATDVAASLTVSRVQLGVLVPAYPLVLGPRLAESQMGDVSIGMGIALSPKTASRWSLTMGMNLATGSAGLLADNGTVKALAAGDTRLGRSFRVGNQLGVALRQAELIPGSAWGRAIDYGAGLAWVPTAREEVALELFGSIGLEGVTVATMPLEALLTDRIGLPGPSGAQLRFGAGGGLGRGLGNPQYRVLAEVDLHGRVDRDQDHDHHPDLIDLCPRRAEDRDHWRDFNGCPDPDNDGDTILDPEDQCPDQAEVFNGWKDDDGCPDRLAEVTVALAQRVDLASIAVDGGTGATMFGGEEKTVEGQPGMWTFEVTADGFEPLKTLFPAPEGRSRVELDPVPIPRSGVAVTAVDPEGNRVPARISLGDDPPVDAPEGWVRIPRRPGPVEVAATAIGLDPATARVEIPRDADVDVTLHLTRPSVAQVGQQLIVGDRIRFAIDEARLEGSEAPLDALAAWLAAHPEVRLVRIEGHADDLGSPAYNLALSTRRAEAVCVALVARGVDPARLQPIGSGESRRVSDLRAERLVDFLVLVWDEPDPR